MLSFKPLHLLFALIALFALTVIAPARANASYEAIEFTATMSSGTSSTAVTIPLVNSKIVDAVVLVPLLDSNDTGTISLTLNAFGKSYVPLGWSDVTIGATEDDAIKKCFSSAAAIYSTDTATVTLKTSTNQAAARTFKVRIIREY